MRKRFAVLAGVLVVLVAGCSGGGDPKPTATPSSPSPSVTSTAPRSSSAPRTSSSAPVRPAVPADVPRTGPNVKPGEKPPVMPAAATQHTPAGAAAFAKFFEMTIDWGYATTSAAYMKHYFQPTCAECKSFAENLTKTHAAGDHFIGGRSTVTKTELLGPSDKYGSEVSVVVTYDLTSLEVVDRRNRYVNADTAHKGVQDQMWLAWRRGAWTVVQMSPVVS